jgi:hypothetical protein
MLGIRDILVRIRIPGFIPLTYGSESGSKLRIQTPDPTPFFSNFKDAKKFLVLIFFLMTYRYPQAPSLQP